MSTALSAASMNPSPGVANYSIKTSHPKNETTDQAINIGNLAGEGTIVTISDAGQQAGAAVSSTFSASAGDVISLANTFSNPIDTALTQFQLYDSAGNLVADNTGTAAQQAAYQQWAVGSYPVTADGTYTVVATPLMGNMPLALSTQPIQGTSLNVSSQLTGSDPAEYYNFSLSSGNNIKMDFSAGSASPQPHVQLYDANGGLVADSAGNSFQQAQFQALTSGTGLAASAGNYQVKVSYANGADQSQNVSYNFQLYSGVNYAIIYNTKVTAQPADNSAAGSVTADPKTQLFSRQAFNQINETPASAVNIGWLAQDKSALQVVSKLTSADNTDQYSFTLQSGNNLKLNLDSKSTPTPSAVHVQLLDSSGKHVIADNQGTQAQKAAYAALTSQTGLQASPGNYIVKVGYTSGVPRTPQNYGFSLYSGTKYNALYKTISSAQTYGNALLTGSLSGSSPSSGIASYLTALSQGSSIDITTALSMRV